MGLDDNSKIVWSVDKLALGNLIAHYSLPSINVNPREWIEVNIYRGVNN